MTTLLNNFDAGCLFKKHYHLRSGNRLPGFDIDGFGMAIKNRNPHGGCRNADGIIFQDFSRFVDHLHLFFGIPVVQERINVRQTVESDWMGIDLALII